MNPLERGLRRLYRRFFKRYGIRQPILIYQMGKVGSLSLYNSLAALYLNVPVYHLHYLNHLDILERDYLSPASRVSLQLARTLREQILNGPPCQWIVITLVRTPVKRNVSAFFEQYSTSRSEVFGQYDQGLLTVLDLLDMFLNEFDHDAPRYWFDSQLQPIFDIDVFATAFPRETGYAIYSSPKARLLVMRLEDMHACASRALYEFLRIPNFKLAVANVAERKFYGRAYKDFIEHADIPASYYERMHGLRYSQHFYTPEELERYDRYPRLPPTC